MLGHVPVTVKMKAEILKINQNLLFDKDKHGVLIAYFLNILYLYHMPYKKYLLTLESKVFQNKSSSLF